MLNEKYCHLQSGTDIRGIACDGVEGQSVTLTDDVVMGSALGFVNWLSKKINKKPTELVLAVGRDSRITGEHIASLVAEQILANRFARETKKEVCRKSEHTSNNHNHSIIIILKNQ